MVLDFDTICVIQAWASPQKEGTIPKEKVGLLLIFKGRCFVSFHHIHHGQWMGSAIHESGIWEIKNSWSFVWDDTDRVWRNEENSDNSRSLWTGDLKHILLIPKPIAYLQLFYRASLTAREFMNQMINVLQWRIAKFTWCGWGSNIYTSMSIRITPVSDRVQQHLREDILPLAESWAGVSLEHTSTYGIRRYTNGSWLISHIDRSQLSLKVYHSFMQYFQVHNPCDLGHPEHRTVC